MKIGPLLNKTMVKGVKEGQSVFVVVFLFFATVAQTTVPLDSNHQDFSIQNNMFSYVIHRKK